MAKKTKLKSKSAIKQMLIVGSLVLVFSLGLIRFNIVNKDSKAGVSNTADGILSEAKLLENIAKDDQKISKITTNISKFGVIDEILLVRVMVLGATNGNCNISISGPDNYIKIIKKPILVDNNIIYCDTVDVPASELPRSGKLLLKVNVDNVAGSESDMEIQL